MPSMLDVDRKSRPHAWYDTTRTRAHIYRCCSTRDQSIPGVTYVRVYPRTCEDEFRRNRRRQHTSGSASSAVSKYSALYSSSSSPIVLQLTLGGTQRHSYLLVYECRQSGCRRAVVDIGILKSWPRNETGPRTGTR